MRAIIIGAGRGSRLMPTTEDAPKCFAEIRGKRILDWTLDALRGGGCTEIVFIGGYRIESVKRDYPDFIFRENKDWENNNILVSLMCAEDLMDRPFVTSYSDILFTKDVVRGLVQSKDELALGIDTDWREHYKPRTQHPPHDGEKVITRGGKVERVYRTIPYDEATGEWQGFDIDVANEIATRMGVVAYAKSLADETGRDGIHGATMASADFGEDAEEKRPTVQVGDPFT